jgi:hypothetical protein
MEAQLALVIQEVALEAKRAIKQQNKMDETHNMVVEKLQQAKVLGDSVAEMKLKRRSKAMVKFQKMTLQEWSSMEKATDHHSSCVLTGEWISYPPGNPKWKVPSSYPVPSHPQQSNMTCPMCVASLWDMCYNEVSD